ncbi:MAG TPA: hypothetical protein VFT34_08590 [Verrucomicrobiae bacterium]|nr:hypothetical protein [Verrucomicrobiae bacterium]
MRTDKRLIVLAAIIALVALGVLLWRGPRRQAQTSAPPESDLPAAAAPSEPMKRKSAQPTNAPLVSTEAIPAFFEAINEFIANARPFGLDNPISRDQIKSIWTNGTGRIVYLETQGHLFEFHGKKLAFFMSIDDGLHTRRDPTARKRWYQASAPWTKEEALKETYAILERLEIKATIDKIEYEATPIHVLTPTGETVEVAPFHTVWLHGTNDIGALEAQYRMSSSGPGRLVRFFTTMP